MARLRAAPDLEQLQHDYEEGTAPVTALVLEHGISQRTLYRLIAKYGWRPRAIKAMNRASETSGQPSRCRQGNKAQGANSLVRLRRLIDRQIAAAEAMPANAAEDEAALEKRARHLASLTRTLEQLLALEQAALKATDEGQEGDDDHHNMLAKLARRLGLDPGDFKSPDSKGN